jgi:hypothetical protein
MTNNDPFIGQLERYLVEYEGPTPLPDTVRDAVHAQLPKTKQIGPISGPVRDIYMNSSMDTPARWGLVAAVVIGAVIIGGAFIFGSGGVGGSPDPTPSPSVEPSEAVAPSAEPSESAAFIPPETALPVGPFVLWDPAAPVQPNWLDPEFDDGPPITVTIPTEGWVFTDSFNLLKGDEVDGMFESAFRWTSTTHGVLVYGDPCQWGSTTPDAPATTAAEIAAALAAQPSRDATGPVELTIGGYPAQRITLHVPEDAVFADCDGGQFASFTLDGYESGPWSAHDGPGQISTFWIVDVDGATVILDGVYRPDTSAERIEEMRSIGESATFELP